MGRVTRFRTIFGVNELTVNSPIWKAMFAEYLGTTFLVLIGCGSCIKGWDPDYKPSIVQIALAFGLAVATIVQSIGHVSGGHINPAVTIGMAVTGKCPVIRSFLYIVCQCAGGITGAGILSVLTPSRQEGNLGSTLVHRDLSTVQAWAVEFLITFALVFTIFAVCDNNRRDVFGSSPLAIGLTVTTAHLFAINYTGSSMNSARSLGPAVFSGKWAHHWVYWIGPIPGGAVAGLLYEFVFSASPPPEPESSDPGYIRPVDLDEKEVIADRTTTI